MAGVRRWSSVCWTHCSPRREPVIWFLGEQDRVGTVAVGRQADLVVIDGNPAT